MRAPVTAEDEAAQADPAAPPAASESFESFYRGYVDRVHRALSITLSDPQLAREATDEAMTRAYIRWRRVRQFDNPGGWAYRVGLNWARSWWRRVHRERALSDHHLSAPSIPPPDAAATAAWQALARLALPARAVVVCRVVLDMSTAETAALLGVAEGTVKSRLARSLSALRIELANADD